MTRRDPVPDPVPTPSPGAPKTTRPPSPYPKGDGVVEAPPSRPRPPDLAPAPRRRHLNRTARNYLDWLDRGGRSDHLPRVLAALDDRPRSRREIADRAAVSVKYTDIAVADAHLGHARPAGTGKHRAGLYARTADEEATP